MPQVSLKYYPFIQTAQFFPPYLPQKQRKSKSSIYLFWETITLRNLIKEDLLCIQNPIKVQTLCTIAAVHSTNDNKLMSVALS